jgi:hypothetical protein
MRIGTGSHSRTAQGQLAKPFFGSSYSFNTQFDLAGIPGKFLPQQHGNRILQMRPANLMNIYKFFGLFSKGMLERIKGRNQVLPDANQSGNMDHRGDHIIARLAQIDMVIGMNRGFAALFPA